MGSLKESFSHLQAAVESCSLNNWKSCLHLSTPAFLLLSIMFNESRGNLFSFICQRSICVCVGGGGSLKLLGTLQQVPPEPLPQDSSQTAPQPCSEPVAEQVTPTACHEQGAGHTALPICSLGPCSKEGFAKWKQS